MHPKHTWNVITNDELSSVNLEDTEDRCMTGEMQCSHSSHRSKEKSDGTEKLNSEGYLIFKSEGIFI